MVRCKIVLCFPLYTRGASIKTTSITKYKDFPGGGLKIFMLTSEERIEVYCFSASFKPFKR